MKHFEYKTRGVCATHISFDLEDNIIYNVHFVGGCNGNLQAISRVVDGMPIEKIEDFFQGIKCEQRATSCSEQLALAARMAYKKLSKEGIG